MPPKGYRKKNRKINVTIPLSPRILNRLEELTKNFPFLKATIAREAISYSINNPGFLDHLSLLASEEGLVESQ